MSKIPDFLVPNTGAEAISFCLDRVLEGSSKEIDAVSDIEGGVYLWRSHVTKICQIWTKARIRLLQYVLCTGDNALTNLTIVLQLPKSIWQVASKLYISGCCC